MYGAMSRYSSKSTLPLNLCAFARPLYELYVVMNLFRCNVRTGGASAIRNDLVAFDLDLQLLVSSTFLPFFLPYAVLPAHILQLALRTILTFHNDTCCPPPACPLYRTPSVSHPAGCSLARSPAPGRGTCRKYRLAFYTSGIGHGSGRGRPRCDAPRRCV